MPLPDSKTRFSSRVSDYVQYRPGYPLELIDLLAAECALTPDSIIADIGSGTGMLAKVFLDNGNAVAGVEPNREMRAAGEEFLAEYGRFTSIDASAEATRLPAHAFDFAVAGQAFHWFDRERTRQEWLRILKPEGWAVLVWNDRRTASSPFLAGYEAVLQEFAKDYRETNHRNVHDKAILEPFFGAPPAKAQFENAQQFDLDGLIGRVASSSYSPARGTPAFESMVGRLGALFAEHEQRGRVAFTYDTLVYFGRMA